MDGGEFILAVLTRWIHVGTAIVLVGGTSFMKLVVAPSLQGQPPELMAAIRGRWKRFVHGGIALFLISGIYNYYQAIPMHKGDGLYHGLIGTKIILALLVFYIASALVGRTTGTQKFRDNAGKWTAFALLLMALIVAISGFAKVRGKGSAPMTIQPTASGAAEPTVESL